MSEAFIWVVIGLFIGFYAGLFIGYRAGKECRQYTDEHGEDYHE